MKFGVRNFGPELFFVSGSPILLFLLKRRWKLPAGVGVAAPEKGVGTGLLHPGAGSVLPRERKGGMLHSLRGETSDEPENDGGKMFK